MHDKRSPVLCFPHDLLNACLQAAGRMAGAAAVLALKPGQSKKQRRASAPSLLAEHPPQQDPLPPPASFHHPGRRQSHPAGLCASSRRASLLQPNATALGPARDGLAHPGRDAHVGSRRYSEGAKQLRPSGHLQGHGQPGHPEGHGLESSAAPRSAEAGQEQPLQQLPQQLQQRLPPRRSKAGRSEGQAVLKGLRLLMTGSDPAAKVEAERVASSMGATILSLDQVHRRLSTLGAQ